MTKILLPPLFKKLFQVFWVVWYDVVSYDLVAFGGDEDVVLDADASEVLVGLKEFVVDIVFVERLTSPEVYEMGDEIDAGFYGHDKALLQPPATAQAVETELRRGAYLFVETDILLS